MVYHESVLVILIQYLYFTYYWRFSLGQRQIVTIPATIDNECTCSIDVSDKQILSKDFPVFVQGETWKVMYPQRSEKNMSFRVGNEIYLDCSGADSMSIGSGTTSRVTTAYVVAKCVYGWIWEYPSLEMQDDIRTAKCKTRKRSWAQLTESNCGEKCREIQMGIRTTKDRFIEIMKVAFNYVDKYPSFASTLIIRGIPATDYDPFEETDRVVLAEFFRLHKHFKDIYLRNHIRASINKQLGLEHTNSKYINLGVGNTLVNSPLISEANYLYSFEKLATWYYINTIPIWQTSMAQNGWVLIEKMCRKYSAIHDVDLHIFAGVHQMLKLPRHVDNSCVPLYLSYDDDKGVLPIPGIIFRTVSDLTNKKGIAILIVNNPYNVCEIEDVCPDVSQDLKWMNYIKEEFEPLKAYACSMTHFRRKLWQLPVYQAEYLLDLPIILSKTEDNNTTVT